MKTVRSLTTGKKPLHTKKHEVKCKRAEKVLSATPAISPKISRPERPASLNAPVIPKAKQHASIQSRLTRAAIPFKAGTESCEEPEEMTFEMLDKYPPLLGECEDMQKTHITCKTAFFTANLERNLPTVSEAMSNMEDMICQAKQSGHRMVKFIHGYGSSGKGGAIREKFLSELAIKKKKREIADYIPGEKFDPFTVTERNLLEKYQSLVNIPEYGRCNHGVTIVFL